MAYQKPQAKRREERVAGVLAGVFFALVGGAGLIYLLLRLLSFGGPNLPGVPPQLEPPALQALSGTPTRTAVPATPVPTPAPTPAGPRPALQPVAQRWVQGFQDRRYDDLYEMLSARAKASIAKDKFVSRYDQIMTGATVAAIKTNLPPVRDPDKTVNRVDVKFDARLTTGRFGDIDEHYAIPITWEANDWRVDWTPDLIFQGLAPDRTVRVFEEDPPRGAIVDRNGQPMAVEQKVPTVGVIPGQLKDKEAAIRDLSNYLQIDPKGMRAKIDAAQPDWWIPLAIFPPSKREELNQKLGSYPGVVLDEKEERFYPQGASAAHIVGYTSPADAEDLKKLANRGYSGGEPVGRMGVEASMDEALSGQRGGRLIISDDGGNTVRTIAERPARPGSTVQLTIDMNVQKQAEAILADKLGSIVLMDPRDNSIIAMATNPRFDPNIFVFGISAEDWKKMSGDPRKVFLNRPAEAAYPSGSIFKPVTFVAGVERGGFSPDTQIDCVPAWRLPGSNIIMKNWQNTPQGKMDLRMGITTSCNPVWYTVGYKLWQTDPDLLATFAQQFGLGKPTGVGAIDEVAGIVVSSEWKKKALGEPIYPGDVVNFAIGQGYFQATPLQMANMYTTIARGGELRTPLLVSKIGPTQGNEPPKQLQAQVKGRVQASASTWAALREGMKGVTMTPRGTGWYAFQGYRIPTAGKTGSAENEGPDAHAWFAGYAPADDPRVVVIVMLEGGKLGGQFAAPLGRQAFEATLGK